MATTDFISPPSALMRGRRWFDTMGVDRLHRAYVSLPDFMTAHDRPLQERVVFFEVPDGFRPHDHLRTLLLTVWHVKPCDEEDRAARGHDAYNVASARDLFDQNSSIAPLLHHTCDLRLFECGWGGSEGIGAEHVHYSRAADIDLFVTPHTAARLRVAIDEIERLYATEPARRALVFAEAA